jgi:hypothetical protein
MGFKGSRENRTPPALLRWTRKAFWLPIFNKLLAYIVRSASYNSRSNSQCEHTGDLPDEVGGDVGPFSSHFYVSGIFWVE